jgi:hypothetical protein
MYQRIVCIGLVFCCVAGLLSACSTGPNFVAVDEPWRAQEELACLASGVVRESPFIKSRSALGGPSVCGAEKPFEMSAAADGRVSLTPAAMFACPMVPTVNNWVKTVVEPAALQHLGTSIVNVKVAASYSCRPRNNQSGGKLSEHGHANALDVSAFMMADGRTVTVKGGWNGAREEHAFLRQVRAESCREFTTVLGPGADAYHGDHFHLDLARHGKDGLGRICK